MKTCNRSPILPDFYPKKTDKKKNIDFVGAKSSQFIMIGYFARVSGSDAGGTLSQGGGFAAG